MNDNSNNLQKNPTHDVEKNGGQTDQDYDEYFIKVFEKNMEKITNISLIIKISQLAGIVSFLIFLIMFAIRVNKGYDFSWFYLLIPALSCILNFALLLNLYLVLKGIFDDVDRKRDDEESSQIGSILTYFCLNTSSVCLFIYLMLFCLKVEEIITARWNLISIPLYLTLGIGLFYWIFIFPAFLQNKLFFEITLIFVYIVCGFIFVVLINLKLDENNTSGIANVFISLFFSLGFHTIYLLFKLFSSLKTDFFSKISSLGFILFLLLALSLVCFKLDGLSNVQNWVPILLIIIGYLLFISDKFISIICAEKEEENTTE